MPGAGDPALVVDAAVAEHLEVLRLPAVGGLGVVGRVQHRDAVHGPLLDAVHRLGLRQLRGFQHGGGHVDHVVELAADLALGLDALGPMEHHAVARAAEVAGHLLGPLEGRVARPGPADGEVGERRGVAPGVDVRHHLVGFADDAVQRHHLVVGAFRTAFGAGAVVAHDVVEDRVVQRADGLQLRHQPSHFVVGVLGEAGEGLHLALEEPLLLGAHVRPGGDFLGPGGELGVGRDHAQLLLTGERLLAQLVPAAAELPLVLGDPLLGHVVRGVRRAGGEVHVEGLVRRQGLLGADPVDRLVGHVHGEVIVGALLVLDAHRAVEDGRSPLVGLAADEAVELVEAGARGPAVVRAGHRDLPRRGFVVLAEGGGAVAVLPQDLGQGRDGPWAHAGVAGKGGGELHDGAGVVGMVVVAGQQGRAGRAAERGRMEAVVLQAAGRQLLQRRHADGSAEGAAVAEADVVDQHDHDVGCALPGPSPRSGPAALALRASSSVIGWRVGSGIGRTVRSSLSWAETVVPAMVSARARAKNAVTRFMYFLSRGRRHSGHLRPPR